MAWWPRCRTGRRSWRGPCLNRRCLREGRAGARVLAYLRGLLGRLERRNGWTLAEAAREASPDGMQRLLRTADRNADTVRDELRGYVVERLGPGGVPSSMRPG